MRKRKSVDVSLAAVSLGNTNKLNNPANEANASNRLILDVGSRWGISLYRPLFSVSGRPNIVRSAVMRW